MPTETATETVKEKTETHTPIQDYTEKVMCDFGHRFYAHSVKLIPFKNSSSASLGELLYIDENKKGCSSLNSAPPAGFLLACPSCGVIHIEGFNACTEEGEALSSDANVIPERAISPSL